MSARLTEEEFERLTARGGHLSTPTMKRIRADRAAILESERDLLAALEHCQETADVSVYRLSGQEDPELINQLREGLHIIECTARLALANARKQDAP